jgi:hypothetical protein
MGVGQREFVTLGKALEAESEKTVADLTKNKLIWQRNRDTVAHRAWLGPGEQLPPNILPICNVVVGVLKLQFRQLQILLRYDPFPPARSLTAIVVEIPPVLLEALEALADSRLVNAPEAWIAGNGGIGPASCVEEN